MAGIEPTKRATRDEAKEVKSESDTTKTKDHHASAADDDHKTPKKRRKVNHACLYCRRSHMTCDHERPCTRCIKRNIGHLCHDEPRDNDSKKSKSIAPAPSATADSETQSDLGRGAMDRISASMGPPSLETTSLSSRPGHNQGHGAKAAFDAATLNPGNPLQLVQPTAVSSIQANALSSTMAQFAGFPDNWLASQNHYHDMHSFHTNYQMAAEVTNEFTLLEEFIQASLVDDNTFPSDSHQNQQSGSNQPDGPRGFGGSLLPASAIQGNQMLPPSVEQAKSISRPASTLNADKTREYYLEAADPHGNDTPEQRMKGILQAKYRAGLLKPFNYINGYARLSSYLDTHVSANSKSKILRQIDRFRVHLRERILNLTTEDLLLVEFWFERSTLDCDRLFASMAIPACCWRRTGEIFRGNKEMAELINVPIEDLQLGKIALHQIMTEDSNVRYWEEFGTVAFDQHHDSLITACSLKNPDDKSDHPVINCCFSFRVRRDDYKIPCLIVGNFLPHDP